MKTNTNKLRKKLKEIMTGALTGVTDKVYYLNFPKPPSYPYVVFELREMIVVDGRTTYQLEVDIVSKDAATTISMADKLGDALDHDAVTTADLFFHSYRSRRYAIVEEDKNIQRVHMQMDLFYYTKED